MNLAAANPGRTLPTVLSILVFVFFLVLPVLITIVFESRRRRLFVLLILSRFLASSFLKLKPFVPEFAEFHFSYLSDDFTLFGWFELSELAFL